MSATYGQPWTKQFWVIVDIIGGFHRFLGLRAHAIARNRRTEICTDGTPVDSISGWITGSSVLIHVLMWVGEGEGRGNL